MSFFRELRRRDVFRVGIAYLAAAWVLIQVVDTILPVVSAPAWILRALVFSSALGFPVVLILAWFYELTPDGIRATSNVEPVEAVEFMGRRLDFAIIGLLGLAVVFLLVTMFVREELASPADGITVQSIAALPFSNESAAEENAEFFANGIHDELLTQLAKIGSLRVISRTSVMEYRDSPKNMREIGRELGVATLLEGRVQRAGNMVRINVQLIDAETDEHLWAETYSRELTAANIFAIQSEMAMSIAETLQATLTPQELSRLGEVPTNNRRAYDFYLTGNDYFARADESENASLAVEAYNRAVDEDPEFVLAWVALVRAHSEAYRFGGDASEARLRMTEEALQRALAVAPDLPEVHLAQAFYRYLIHLDYGTALTEFALAEAGMPGSIAVLNGRAGLHRRAGRWEESLADRNRAVELDPRNIDQLISLGTTYAQLRDYTNAERIYGRALEIAPDNAYVFWVKAQVPLWRAGDVNFIKAVAENPPIRLGDFREEMGWTAAIYERDYATALSYLDDWDIETFRRVPKATYYGETYWLSGQHDLARTSFQEVRRLLETKVETNPGDHWSYVLLGQALARLGEYGQAIRMGEHALALMPVSKNASEGGVLLGEVVFRVFLPANAYDMVIEKLDSYLGAPGWYSIEGFLPDPRLDPIRDDRRFQALVDKFGR